MSLEKARVFPGPALNAVEQPVDVGRKAVPGRLPLRRGQNLHPDLLHRCGQQLRLAGKIVVDRAHGDPGLGRHRADA